MLFERNPDLREDGEGGPARFPLLREGASDPHVEDAKEVLALQPIDTSLHEERARLPMHAVSVAEFHRELADL